MEAAGLAAGGGYLFDNVTVTTRTSTGTDCSEGGDEDIVIDKTTQTRVAAAGDLINYQITVRNRGEAPAHGVRACDRAPRALRFMGASTRLQRAAVGVRCLAIPLLGPGQRRSFRATFRLREGVTADTVTNGATADTPTGSVPSATQPDAGNGARDGTTNAPRRRRHDRDAARIAVQGTPRACPAALNSRVRRAC